MWSIFQKAVIIAFGVSGALLAESLPLPDGERRALILLSAGAGVVVAYLLTLGVSRAIDALAVSRSSRAKMPLKDSASHLESQERLASEPIRLRSRVTD